MAEERARVHCPAKGAGKTVPLKCGDCDYTETVTVEFGADDETADCPCGGLMSLDWGQLRPTVTSRGAGFHSTAWGRRRKKEFIERNERLKKEQWENHPVPYDGDPEKVANPTPGGPVDAAKKKAAKKPTIVLPSKKKKD